MKALILVDIQNDFLPGGALAVANGDAVVPVANEDWLKAKATEGLLIEPKVYAGMYFCRTPQNAKTTSSRFGTNWQSRLSRAGSGLF